MDDKLFLYYILEEDGRSARIVNQTVQYLGEPSALPQTPDGWQSILFAYERDLNSYGNVRKFSLPLGFVLDGATILRDGLYRSNTDRKLYLLIQKRVTEIDATYYRTFYDYLYKGEFDFSTFKDEQGEESKVSINLQEGGIAKMIKANETTQYTIPFDDDAVNIKMDGVALQEKHNYQFQPGTAGGSVITPQREGVFFVNKEGQANGFASFTVFKGALGTLTPADTNYFAAATQTITGMRIYTPQQIFIQPQILETQYKLYLRIYHSGTNTFDDVELVNEAIGTGKLIDFDEFFDVAADDRLYLYSPTTIIHGEDQAFIIEFTSTFKTTFVKAFSPWQLFRKLIERITGNASFASSALLQASTYFVTSGDGLRSIDQAGIKTTLADFRKAYDVYHMAGYAVESGLYVFERRSHFFQTGNSTELGSVKNFTITPATELKFSSVRVGHREQTSDDVNGKFGFNGYQVYTSPYQRGSKELDLQSPYKADPYEIELTRINFDGRTTTDSQSDNDVFVIDVNQATTVIETTISFISPSLIVVPNGIELLTGMTFSVTGSASNDGTYTITGVSSVLIAQIVNVAETVVSEANVPVTITLLSGIVYSLRRDIAVTAGVPSPASVFNVGLSPKRILLTHGGWLRGVLQGYEGGKLIFQSGNRNNDLIAGGITEKADVAITSLAPAMISPWYLEFDTQAPTTLPAIMEETPNKDFSGLWGPVPFEGFLIEAGIAPNTEEDQNYKLLAIPATDMKKFINLPA